MHLPALAAARQRHSLSELLCALARAATPVAALGSGHGGPCATVAPCRSHTAAAASGARRYAVSTRSESVAAARSTVDAYLEVPGGRVPYTPELRFLGGPDAPIPTMPCYRTIDSTGQDVPGAHIPHPLSQVREHAGAGGKDMEQGRYRIVFTLRAPPQPPPPRPPAALSPLPPSLPLLPLLPRPSLQELSLRLYGAMARLQTMDTMFYEAQRQVRRMAGRGEVVEGQGGGRVRPWGMVAGRGRGVGLELGTGALGSGRAGPCKDAGSTR